MKEKRLIEEFRFSLDGDVISDCGALSNFVEEF